MIILSSSKHSTTLHFLEFNYENSNKIFLDHSYKNPIRVFLFLANIDKRQKSFLENIKTDSEIESKEVMKAFSELSLSQDQMVNIISFIKSEDMNIIKNNSLFLIDHILGYGKYFDYDPTVCNIYFPKNIQNHFFKKIPTYFGEAEPHSIFSNIMLNASSEYLDSYNIHHEIKNSLYLYMQESNDLLAVLNMVRNKIGPSFVKPISKGSATFSFVEICLKKILMDLNKCMYRIKILNSGIKESNIDKCDFFSMRKFFFNERGGFLSEALNYIVQEKYRNLFLLLSNDEHKLNSYRILNLMIFYSKFKSPLGSIAQKSISDLITKIACDARISSNIINNNNSYLLSCDQLNKELECLLYMSEIEKLKEIDNLVRKIIKGINQQEKNKILAELKALLEKIPSLDVFKNVFSKEKTKVDKPAWVNNIKNMTESITFSGFLIKNTEFIQTNSSFFLYSVLDLFKILSPDCEKLSAQLASKTRLKILSEFTFFLLNESISNENIQRNVVKSVKEFCLRLLEQSYSNTDIKKIEIMPVREILSKILALSYKSFVSNNKHKQNGSFFSFVLQNASKFSSQENFQESKQEKMLPIINNEKTAFEENLKYIEKQIKKNLNIYMKSDFIEESENFFVMLVNNIFDLDIKDQSIQKHAAKILKDSDLQNIDYNVWSSESPESQFCFVDIWNILVNHSKFVFYHIDEIDNFKIMNSDLYYTFKDRINIYNKEPLSKSIVNFCDVFNDQMTKKSVKIHKTVVTSIEILLSLIAPYIYSKEDLKQKLIDLKNEKEKLLYCFENTIPQNRRALYKKSSSDEKQIRLIDLFNIIDWKKIIDNPNKTVFTHIKEQMLLDTKLSHKFSSLFGELDITSLRDRFFLLFEDLEQCLNAIKWVHSNLEKYKNFQDLYYNAACSNEIINFLQTIKLDEDLMKITLNTSKDLEKLWILNVFRSLLFDDIETDQKQDERSFNYRVISENLKQIVHNLKLMSFKEQKETLRLKEEKFAIDLKAYIYILKTQEEKINTHKELLSNVIRTLQNYSIHLLPQCVEICEQAIRKYEPFANRNHEKVNSTVFSLYDSSYEREIGNIIQGVHERKKGFVKDSVQKNLTMKSNSNFIQIGVSALLFSSISFFYKSNKEEVEKLEEIQLLSEEI